MKKEAIWSIGDPGLPGQLTERDIPSGLEEDVVDTQTGESEIEVDWQQFRNWFATGGEQLPGVLANRPQPSGVVLTYTYSYDYNENRADNIKAEQLIDVRTKGVLRNPYLLSAFISYYDDQIRSDIELSEQDVKTERVTNSDPF